MEPSIQIARTSDGVDLAFWSMGEGPALVAMPSMPWSHLQLEWTIPEMARWYGELARGRRLLRYDGRGFGLSQRETSSFDLEAHVRDLEAVVDKAGLERFDLYAAQHSGPPAIAYSVRHPERVSHLVLFCAYSSGAVYGSRPLTQATRLMILEDWDFYAEAVSRLLLGWTEPEAVARFAALVRECTTPEIASKMLAATVDIDVTGLLPEVHTPTLVVQRRGLRSASMDHPRAIAGGIPGARLVILEGTSVAPYLGDTGAVIDELDAFLSDGEIHRSSRHGRGALQTILFTDMEGSTTLTSRLGDTAARIVLREHEEIVRAALHRHGGDEVKAMGDGFMAAFGSAVAAVECAIGLQRAFADRNATAVEPIRIRVGMNAGEPIAEAGDLFGTAVIAAARIGAQAGVGQIHVSDVVRQLVAGKGFRFTDLGPVELRGLEEPVRLHSVDWA